MRFYIMLLIELYYFHNLFRNDTLAIIFIIETDSKCSLFLMIIQLISTNKNKNKQSNDRERFFTQ